MPEFLVDECLSLELVEVARSRGFPESSHIVWMGKSGWKDWQLKPFILAGDWTFLARNSVDFLKPAINGRCISTPEMLNHHVQAHAVGIPHCWMIRGVRLK